MNQALPSESYIARLDYLAFNGKVCSSVEYSDEQRFLEDLDTLPKGLFVEDNPHRKPPAMHPKKKDHEPAR